jgi:hypothetical protein
MKLIGENRSPRRKTCPSAILSTTNPTWTDLGSNPGLRGERPATNHLSHGTARFYGDTWELFLITGCCTCGQLDCGDLLSRQLEFHKSLNNSAKTNFHSRQT